MAPIRPPPPPFAHRPSFTCRRVTLCLILLLQALIGCFNILISTGHHHEVHYDDDTKKHGSSADHHHDHHDPVKESLETFTMKRTRRTNHTDTTTSLVTMSNSGAVHHRLGSTTTSEHSTTRQGDLSNSPFGLVQKQIINVTVWIHVLEAKDWDSMRFFYIQNRIPMLNDDDGGGGGGGGGNVRIRFFSWDLQLQNTKTSNEEHQRLFPLEYNPVISDNSSGDSHDEWLVIIPSSAYVQTERLGKWIVRMQQQQQQQTLSLSSTPFDCIHVDLPKIKRDWSSRKQHKDRVMNYALIVAPSSRPEVINRTCLLHTNRWMERCIHPNNNNNKNNSSSSSGNTAASGPNGNSKEMDDPVQNGATTITPSDSICYSLSREEASSTVTRHKDERNTHGFVSKSDSQLFQPNACSTTDSSSFTWLFPNQFPYGFDSHMKSSLYRVLQLHKMTSFPSSCNHDRDTDRMTSATTITPCQTYSMMLHAQRTCEGGRDFRYDFQSCWKPWYDKRNNIICQPTTTATTSPSKQNQVHFLPTRNIPALTMTMPNRIQKTKQRMELYLPSSIFSPQGVILAERGNSTFSPKSFGVEGYRRSYTKALQKGIEMSMEQQQQDPALLNPIFLVLDDDFRVHVDLEHGLWNDLTGAVRDNQDSSFTANHSSHEGYSRQCYLDTLTNGGALLLGGFSHHKTDMAFALMPQGLRYELLHGVESVSAATKSHKQDGSSSNVSPPPPPQAALPSCFDVYRGTYGSHAVLWTLPAARKALDWLTRLTPPDRAFDSIWADLAEAERIPVRLTWQALIVTDLEHSSAVDARRVGVGAVAAIVGQRNTNMNSAAAMLKAKAAADVAAAHEENSWDASDKYKPDSGVY